MFKWLTGDLFALCRDRGKKDISFEEIRYISVMKTLVISGNISLMISVGTILSRCAAAEMQCCLKWGKA